MSLCRRAVGVRDIHSQPCDKSVFISAWLNGNDRNLKSNIIEQNNKKKNGTTNKKQNEDKNTHYTLKYVQLR